MTVTASVTLASCRVEIDLLDRAQLDLDAGDLRRLETGEGRAEFVGAGQYARGTGSCRRVSVVVGQHAGAAALGFHGHAGENRPDASFTTPSTEPRCSWAATGQANSVIASNAAKVLNRMNSSSLMRANPACPVTRTRRLSGWAGYGVHYTAIGRDLINPLY